MWTELKGKESASGVAIRCGGCAKPFGVAAWLALSLQQSLSARDLAGYLSSCPPALVIEVRRCSACGRGIARKRPPSACGDLIARKVSEQGAAA
jgi:hypothetical protein